MKFDPGRLPVSTMVNVDICDGLKTRFGFQVRANIAKQETWLTFPFRRQIVSDLKGGN